MDDIVTIAAQKSVFAAESSQIVVFRTLMKLSFEPLLQFYLITDYSFENSRSVDFRAIIAT